VKNKIIILLSFCCLLNLKGYGQIRIYSDDSNILTKVTLYPLGDMTFFRIGLCTSDVIDIINKDSVLTPTIINDSNLLLVLDSVIQNNKQISHLIMKKNKKNIKCSIDVRSVIVLTYPNKEITINYDANGRRIECNGRVRKSKFDLRAFILEMGTKNEPR
jgi:hypothetical protein